MSKKRTGSRKGGSYLLNLFFNSNEYLKKSVPQVCALRNPIFGGLVEEWVEEEIGKEVKTDIGQFFQAVRL